MEVAGKRIPQHGLRILGIWAVGCAIMIPLLVLVLGPHVPPGKMSAEASAQTDANTILIALLAPLLLMVVVYFVYSLIVFRARGATDDGAPIHGHAGIQLTWVVATAIIVLALAAWGSYTLVDSARGAGGGQGPSPTDIPKGANHALQVQVIAQQWAWTFRYPSFGGFETRELALPNNTVVAFHVTSLDVTHSFWAYELGVKADAVPGVDNVAYVQPRKEGSFSIRCSELCGLWHGHMATHGHVLSASGFTAWVAQQRQKYAPSQRYLVPYSRTYFPEPKHRAG
jgi:cytochrome c oxidase subunit II